MSNDDMIDRDKQRVFSGDLVSILGLERLYLPTLENGYLNFAYSEKCILARDGDVAVLVKSDFPTFICFHLRGMKFIRLSSCYFKKIK